MIRDKNKIAVLSYLPSRIALTTRNRSLVMQPSDGVSPVKEQFTFDEVEYINDHCNVFRLGMLEFADADRDELYDELNIQRDNCLYERDIDKLLLSGDEDSLKRIVSITDPHTIERVRGHMVKLASRIHTRVVDVVNYRYNEIRQGRRSSKIAVEPAPQPQTDWRDEKMEAMQKQMEAMQQMLMQFAQMQQGGISTTPAVVTETQKPAENVVATPQEATQRKGGRPPKAAQAKKSVK